MTGRGEYPPMMDHLRQKLVQLCGAKGATSLPGLPDHLWLVLVGEVGTDLTR